ncbi:MAG: hypothetical protein ACREAM_29905 [Blastocatellia bacterium]
MAEISRRRPKGRIRYARGKYLTGDTGYAGLPMTEQHNTILFDGAGQAREGN